jgi:hypothetical protein
MCLRNTLHAYGVWEADAPGPHKNGSGEANVPVAVLGGERRSSSRQSGCDDEDGVLALHVADAPR